MPAARQLLPVGAALALALAPFGALPTGAAAASSDSATTFQIGPSHDGTQSGDSLLPPLTRKWTFSITGQVSYPVIAAGKVFVTVSNNAAGYGTTLYAIDQASGSTSWSLAIPGSYYWSAAAFDNGVLFVVNLNGVLRALDPATGSLKWMVTLPEFAQSAPSVLNGTLYLNGSGHLYAISESDGSQLWSSPITHGGNSSPVASATGIYVSLDPQHVYDFNPTTGALIWEHNPVNAGSGGATAALHNGLLYVRDVSGDSSIILNASTGATVGSFPAGTIPAFGGGNTWFSLSGLPDGSRNQATLEGRDTTTNAVRWSFAGDGSLVTPPVYANGYVYVGSAAGHLYAVEASSGRQVWSDVNGGMFRTDETNLSQPSAGLGIGGGMLVVPIFNGLIAYTGQGPAPALPAIPAGQANGPDQANGYQIDAPHSGEQPAENLAMPLAKKWSVDFPNPVSYPVIADDRVFVTVANAGDGTGASLYALDQTSGVKLWGPVDAGYSNWHDAHVTYDAGRLYLLSDSGILRALDAQTGLQLWSRILTNQFFFSTPPVAANGMIYVVGNESGATVYAVDEATGVERWHAPLSGDTTTPAVTSSGVYLAFSCQGTDSLDPNDGHVIWRVGATATCGGGEPAALFAGRVFNRDLFNPSTSTVLDANTGAILGHFAATQSPAFAGTSGFYLNGASVEAHDLNSGALLWSFGGDGQLDTPTATDQHHVYVGSKSGVIYALDQVTGQQLWSGNTGSPVLPSGPSGPVDSIGIGQGLLVVPASSRLVAYGAGVPPFPTPSPTPTPSPSPGGVRGPETSSWGQGRLDLFVKGADGALWHKFYDASVGWSGWSSLGAPAGVTLASDPVAISWGYARIDIFVRGSDNALWHKYYDVNLGGWSGWFSHGGSLTSGPAAASSASGRLDVFYRGSDNSLRHIFYAATVGAWSSEYNHGGNLASDPSAVSWGVGRIDVVARGTDGSLQHDDYDQSRGGWLTAWETVPGDNLQSGPTITTWGPGRLDVFAQGSDTTLQHTYFAAGNWQGWTSQANPSGNQMTSDPGGVAWSYGRLDIFARGQNNTLLHKLYDSSSGWSAWYSESLSPTPG